MPTGSLASQTVSATRVRISAALAEKRTSTRSLPVTGSSLRLHEAAATAAIAAAEINLITFIFGLMDMVFGF
jgi:hypothetical protein